MIGNSFIKNPAIIGSPQSNQFIQPLKTVEKPSFVNSYMNLSDVTGCGHYRVLWPTMVLSSKYSKDRFSFGANVIKEEDFFRGITFFRVQRMVPDHHLRYLTHARKLCDKYNVPMVYELDDIPLYEDIPVYNKHRSAYASPNYRSNIVTMMNMCDEVTVSTSFMKNYFLEKISNKNLTVLPNYMPRFWMDRYYDENTLKVNFSKNKKKPRILYAGSSSHYSVNGVVEDDFTALVDLVKKTYKEYSWVFFGGVPRALHDFVHSGKIEFVKGCSVIEYPHVFNKIKANITIAPLLKNNFNRAKSNIKLIEAGAFGIPCICQEGVEPYKEAIYKFTTPSDLHDQIKKLTKDVGVYMKACRKSNMLAQKYWLEDNISIWDELVRHPYGSDLRVGLNALNK